MRAFLLTPFRFLVSDDGDGARAQKRGGGAVLPFEASPGEQRYEREPRTAETPGRIYERHWAFSTLARSIHQWRSEFEQHGKLESFEKLNVSLTGASEARHAVLVREMNASEGTPKVSIHRLRKRYREFFQMKIAATVADPAELDQELRCRAGALTGR